MENNEVYILDSPVFISGFTEFTNKKFITSKLVLKEIKSKNLIKKINIIIKKGLIKIIKPKEEYIKKIIEISKEIGDFKKLSQTDIEILAIALEGKNKGKNVIIVSDDYSLQNIAKYLGIEIRGVHFPKIKKSIEWQWYCPSCFKKYNNGASKVCQICGSELKRKPKKLRNI
ncbi:MAG: PIN domain-containing protein [Nitrososphaerota archaeon]